MAAASHSQLDRFDQMTVIQLRNLLREHKLPTSGIKADLVDRARSHQLRQKVTPIPPQRQKVIPIQPPPPQRPSPIPPPPQRPSPIPPPPQRPSPIPPPPQRPSPIPPPPQRPSPIPPPPQRSGQIKPPPQRPSPIQPPQVAKTFFQRKKTLLRSIETSFPGIKDPGNRDALGKLRINISQLTLEELADLEYLKHLIESNRLLIMNNGEITMIQGFLALPDGEVLLHP